MTAPTTVLERATRLLLPLLDEDRRGTWLTQAFYGQDKDDALYHAIDQRGATDAFTTRCVRQLLERGLVGSRHALSLLLEVIREHASDERQADFA